MAEHCICTEHSLLRACPVHGVLRDESSEPLDLGIDDLERLHRFRVEVAALQRQWLGLGREPGMKRIERILSDPDKELNPEGPKTAEQDAARELLMRRRVQLSRLHRLAINRPQSTSAAWLMEALSNLRER